MLSSITSTSALEAALRGLAREVSRLPHDGESGAELLRRTNGYLIPRLANPTAPLLVAVIGPTGSGKSTLLNSLARRSVSPTGPLRPTTRRPVVWCHRSHAGWGPGRGGAATVVADDHPLLRGVSVVDTPDLDSAVRQNRQVALEVTRGSDAAVFVTSPQRYGDEAPWVALGEVLRRGRSVIYVMNRLSRRSGGAVPGFVGLLRAADLDPAGGTEAMIAVQEQHLDGEGLLPPAALRRLEAMLAELADRREDVLAAVIRAELTEVMRLARRLGDVADVRAEIGAVEAAAEREGLGGG